MRSNSTSLLDEVFVTICGKLHYLWRAVDQDGDTIDILVQKRRNKRAELSQEPTRLRERQMRRELLITFSGIPTSIGGLFLTADATLASAEPSQSSPARQLYALPTTRDDSIPASQSNPPLG